MTSTTDEIANLRAGLEAIADFCAETAADQHMEPDQKRAWLAIAQRTLKTLKTPRASKSPTVGEIMSWDE